MAIFQTLSSIQAATDIVSDNMLPVGAGAAGTALLFFLKRFVTQTDKTQETSAAISGKIESLIASVNGDIRQINKEIGRFESSEQKQWLTHDNHVRELSEIKLRVSIIETKLK